jgi:hypothetical protein
MTNYSQLLGKPQGDELVYGKEIIRRIDTFKFDVVGRFNSNKEANDVYNDWIKENQRNRWNYSKPITGWDAYNNPIFVDSWGTTNESYSVF